MTTPQPPGADRSAWRRLGLTGRGGVAAGAAAAVIGVVIALIVALTSGGHRSKVAATPASTATPTRTATSSTPTKAKPAPKAKLVNPLTGGPLSDNQVVAVKIDDTAAGRPLVGIDKADIVYVLQVEGGLTRLLAIYNSVLPTVEPVRSTRVGDPEIALQYGPIDYVASGGSAGELAPLDRSSLREDINDRGGPGFGRDASRPEPYNLSADLAAIAGRLKGPTGKSVGLVWSSRLVNPGSRPGAAVRTIVGGTPVAFDWSASMHRYARLIDGAVQHAADAATIATPNVIVQFCRVTPYPEDIDSAGNPAMVTTTIGSGKVSVFRDGRRIDGTWSRSSVHDGTHLSDVHGNPIALAPGGAWFVMVAVGTPLE